MNGGLHLVISAPTAEIYENSYRLILLITVLMVASTAAILAISRPICTRIVQMAYTDCLTGLPNREYFRDIYDSRMKEKNIQSTMFMLDIDHFKMVNDTYGHAVGDKVLTAVAGEIRDIFGKNAILSRWGGDEFVGIIPSERGS
jgi:GGDEF domain-containing protein